MPSSLGISVNPNIVSINSGSESEGSAGSDGEADSSDDDAPLVDQNGELLSEKITTGTAMKEYGGMHPSLSSSKLISFIR